MNMQSGTESSGLRNPSVLLYDKLRQHGLNTFASVPCKLLDGLIKLMAQDQQVIHTPVTREEEGVGLLGGAALAGRRSALVMQNSGLGNSINAIRSFVSYFELPMVFIISHRGTEGEKIDAQKPMGRVTADLLKAIDVPYYEIKNIADLPVMDAAVSNAFEENRPVAFLFPFSYWKE